MILKWFSFPRVDESFNLPKFPGQFCYSIFPSLDYSHAFIELHSHIWEGTLPHISFLEFVFYPSSYCLGCNSKELFHSNLLIWRWDLRIFPNAVKCILNLINKGSDLSKLHSVQVIELLGNLGEVAIYNFSLSPQIFILLTSIVFSFVFLPYFYLICWW